MLIRRVPIFPSCIDEYESEYGLKKIHDKYDDNNNNTNNNNSNGNDNNKTN